MARPARIDVGGLVYHVLNRANARRVLFEDVADYRLFLACLAQARERSGIRLCAFCAMPNHWHAVVWPDQDGQVAAFAGRLALLHTQRVHAIRGSAGEGPLYQGRYRSFMVQEDAHFLTVCRYVERNPVRAGLVEHAAAWPWSSRGYEPARGGDPLATVWPLPRPQGWARLVDEPLTPAELDDLRLSANRGRPYGEPAWRERTSERFGLRATLRDRGRPRRG